MIRMTCFIGVAAPLRIANMNDVRKMILESPQRLAEAAARAVVEEARQAIEQRGRFGIALAGGTTPELAYRALAENFRADTDWSRWFVFFSDERFVAPNDPRSNYGMAWRFLLAYVPIPPARIFPVPTGEPSVASAAAAYETRIKAFFANGPPVFDVILLGLGEDGHTASLFPHSAALAETRRLVASGPPGRLPPPVDRVTFTFPLINMARAVFFLVAGAKKAPVLRKAFQPESARAECPAVGVRPQNGRVTFFLDRAAAGSDGPGILDSGPALR